MTPRDEYLFVHGLVVGAALAVCEGRREIDQLDERLRRVERAQEPPRIVGRLVPVGWRRGQRVYQIVRA